MALDDTKTVITPEQVAVTYRLAGIGTRFAAMLLDTFAQVAAGMALVLIFPNLERSVPRFVEQASAWLVALLALLAFGILWGYFIFWEAVWSGRSPGKRLAGIRVIRDSGHPVDFRAVFLRNICRYVDFLPVAYGVGTTVMFFSKDSKRLGDYVAGTIVVVDAQGLGSGRPADGSEVSDYRLLGDPSLLNLRAISRNDLAVVDRFLQRREGLLEGPRAELARRIAEPLLGLLGMEVQPQEYPYEAFLQELAAACRRRSEA